MSVLQRVIGRGSRAPPPLRHHCDRRRSLGTSKSQAFLVSARGVGDAEGYFGPPYPNVAASDQMAIRSIRTQVCYQTIFLIETIRINRTKVFVPAPPAFVLETLGRIPAQIGLKAAARVRWLRRCPRGCSAG